MKKQLLALCLTLGTTASFASAEAVGMLIKNKSTKEILGVTCLKKNDVGACDSFQFIIMQVVSKNEYQVMEKVGKSLTYSQVKSLAESTRDSVKSYLNNDSWAESEGVYVEPLSGLPIAMIAGDYGDTTFGEIWRRVAGVIMLPVTLAVDGVRVAAEGVAWVATEIVYELPNAIAAKSHAKEIHEGVILAVQKKQKNKMIRVKNVVFETAVDKIRHNY